MPAIGLAILVGASGCGGDRADEPGAPASREPAGTIAGVYVQEHADHTGREPVSGVVVGLYTDPFLPGPDMKPPPAPIATARTGGGGVFSFTNVAPGEYFLTTIGAAVFTAGEVVTLTEDRGARVELVGCIDCPAPA